MIQQLIEMFQEFLRDSITSNYTGMFEDINTKVSEIAVGAGQTPESWNGAIFSMIRNLSETIIIPIAGMIIAAILCYELVTLFSEKNNLNDSVTYPFFKFILKAGIAVYLLSHTFDIAMAIFDVGHHIVNSAAGFISGSAEIDVSSALAALQGELADMETVPLIGLLLETSIAKLCLWAISILVVVRVNLRMINIYLYCSAAPIPFATLTNREWGQTGNNYIRGLVSLAFEGFLMMAIVAIYAALVLSLDFSGNLHVQTLMILAYTVLLVLSLFKTETLSKSIFHAH